MSYRSIAVLASFATLSAAGTAVGQAPPALKSQNIVTNLNFPTFLTHAPGDKCRIFVTEKRGVIKVLNIGTNPPTLIGTFLDIDALVGGSTTVGGEQGLLGLAFHPDYASNGFFFVNYTNNSGHTVVARYRRSDGNPNVADAASALIVMTINQPESNHNGGWMGFGPDGYLYIATGDGGSANDPWNNAQTLTTKLGKMLRIDPNVNGTSPTYFVPSSNPLASGGGDATIWAYGLRNPWRCSFDRLTGDLYIGDVGQGSREEINFQEAGATNLRNYGWRCKEGNLCTGLTGCTCPSPTLTDPIRVYNYGAGTSNGRCIIGGYMYRGCAIPDLQGFYIHGDYVNNNYWAMRYTPSGGVTNHTLLNSQLNPSLQGTTVNSLASFGEDGRGEIYIVKHSSTTSGGIFKIVAASGVDACPPRSDFNTDGWVNGSDLGVLLGAWGPAGGYGVADLDCNGVVDGSDLGILLGAWSQ